MFYAQLLGTDNRVFKGSSTSSCNIELDYPAGDKPKTASIYEKVLPTYN